MNAVLIFHVAALTAGFAAPALADCPAPSDMVHGIVFDTGDGAQQVFRRLDADRVEVVRTEQGDSYRDVLAHGVFWTYSQALSGSTTSGLPALRSADPPFSAADLPVAKGVWQAHVRTIWDGADFEKGRLTYSWNMPETIKVGICPLSAITGAGVEVTADGTIHSQALIYLTGYGLTLVTAYRTGSDPFVEIFPTMMRAVQ